MPHYKWWCKKANFYLIAVIKCIGITNTSVQKFAVRISSLITVLKCLRKLKVLWTNLIYIVHISSLFMSSLRAIVIFHKYWRIYLWCSNAWNARMTYTTFNFIRRYISCYVIASLNNEKVHICPESIFPLETNQKTFSMLNMFVLESYWKKITNIKINRKLQYLWVFIFL